MRLRLLLLLPEPAGGDVPAQPRRAMGQLRRDQRRVPRRSCVGRHGRELAQRVAATLHALEIRHAQAALRRLSRPAAACCFPDPVAFRRSRGRDTGPSSDTTSTASPGSVVVAAGAAVAGALEASKDATTEPSEWPVASTAVPKLKLAAGQQYVIIHIHQIYPLSIGYGQVMCVWVTEPVWCKFLQQLGTAGSCNARLSSKLSKVCMSYHHQFGLFFVVNFTQLSVTHCLPCSL